MWKVLSIVLLFAVPVQAGSELRLLLDPAKPSEVRSSYTFPMSYADVFLKNKLGLERLTWQQFKKLLPTGRVMHLQSRLYGCKAGDQEALDAIRKQAGNDLAENVQSHCRNGRLPVKQCSGAAGLHDWSSPGLVVVRYHCYIGW